jgi:hypothetical protein
MSHSPLLLQLIIILATARACGLLLRYIGQPPVIGEMAAGLLLGPIVFGAWFPEFHARVFAPETLPGLTSLSTLGLVFFMFIVGVELRAPDGVRAQFKAAGAVGVLSVLAPIALGLGIAPFLYPLAPAGVAFWPFALFIDHRIPGTGAHPQGARHDPDPTRPPGAQWRGHRRRVRMDPAGAGGGVAGLRQRLCRFPENHFGIAGDVRAGVRCAATALRLAHASPRR